MTIAHDPALPPTVTCVSRDTPPSLEESPVLSLYGYQEGDNITGPQARQVAAALLDAADEWDRITGASS